jgi:hypothetical protein
VTGDDDRYRIGAVGRADRAYRRRPADGSGDGAIAAQLAVADLLQRLPNRHLEWCAAKVQRHTKVAQVALKVGGQLFGQIVEGRCILP